MNPTNASHYSSNTSSTPSASSLRPRNRRLISGPDDELESEIQSGQSTRRISPFGSPFNSRTASPIPSTHPSRTDPSRTSPKSNPASNSRPLGGLGGLSQRNNHDSSASFSGIWGNSWSALQGLASDVLGNDTAPKGKQPRTRRPLEATHRRISSSAPPKQWGPTGSIGAQIGVGSREERENLVRAMKRKDLLAANGHIYPDSAGRIKRRSSDDRISVSAPPAEQEDRDALVYVHRVRPEDTLAGITIRFNCQPAVLRKANRMWPNDSVQARQTIVLPVDACGVKGRPVLDPKQHEEDDLLLDGYGESSSDNDRTPTQTPIASNGWHPHDSTSQSTSLPRPPSSANSSHAESEPPWKHDSWVLLPDEAVPTEIARLPRKTLGFFPPARRKSLTFSDAPSSSLDLPRSSTSTNSTTSHTSSPSLTSVKNDSSTTITPLTSNGPSTHQRPRTISVSAFSLHGPGGVGTLGKNVRSPGPAQDGLNKLFAAHLPNVAPPPEQEYLTPWYPGLLDIDASLDGSDTPTSPHMGTGGRSTASRTGGGGLDFENVGHAVEGWVRKLASRASTMLSEPSSSSAAGRGSAVPVIGVVGGDLGDLIELRGDAFEIGDDDEESERGRQGTNAAFALPGTRQYGTGRLDAGLSVRERGRGRNEGAKID